MDYKMVEEYIVKDGLKDIRDFLKYLAYNNIEFCGWQKDENNRRNIIQLFMDDLNPVEPELRLLPAQDGFDLSCFVVGSKLSIYTHSQRYLAEMKIVYVGKKHLIVLPPQKLHVKAQRRVPRLYLEDRNNLLAGISKNKREFTLSIMDISETGMALKISRNQAKYFGYPGDEITIFNLFSDQLTSTIAARVIYINPIADSPYFRLGVNFYDEIELVSKLKKADIEDARP